MRIEFNSEDDFNKQKEKFEEFDIEYNLEQEEDKYIITVSDKLIINLLTFLSELISLSTNCSGIGDKEISPLIKKLLIIHNRIVLNEDIDE